MKSYEEYFKSRTVADIMEDYSEQRNEWETLLVRKYGKVKQFRHENGKDYYTVDYEEEFGEINWPQGFEILLKNKRIEEQMNFYCITNSVDFAAAAYDKISEESIKKHATMLCDYPELVRLIIKDNYLVGVIIRENGETKRLLPYHSDCTDDSANTDNVYLVCIPH